MKANELRIGNKVDIYGNVATIVPNDFEKWIDVKNNSYVMKNLKPIELTEEWLIRLGFEKHKGVYRIELRDNFYLRCAFHKKMLGCVLDEYCCDDISRETVALNPVYYVHQLQYLYFALTNEELNL